MAVPYEESQLLAARQLPRTPPPCEVAQRLCALDALHAVPKERIGMLGAEASPEARRRRQVRRGWRFPAHARLGSRICKDPRRGMRLPGFASGAARSTAPVP